MNKQEIIAIGPSESLHAIVESIKEKISGKRVIAISHAIHQPPETREFTTCLVQYSAIIVTEEEPKN